ncbi:MAG: aminopeptidase P family protein [Desulfatibacillaceae bacterium]|nr:aminopeptidase P family protein [Desulfatibacillaceae bacterium]
MNGFDYKGRVEKLRLSMQGMGADALMISIEENRRYLSGFTGQDGRFDESAGTLFISTDKLVLATDSRFVLQAQNQCPNWEVFEYRQGLEQSLPQICQILNAKKLGFEKVRLSLASFEKMKESLQKSSSQVELLPLENLVEPLRLIKDETEILTMRKALLIAETAFNELLDTLAPGMTEKEAAFHLESLMHSLGAEEPSFPTIAAFGENSAMPHAIPGDKKLKEGQPALFDWGCKADGYCSDISRMMVFGEPDKKFWEIYNIVHEARDRAIAAVKPGASSKTVDAAARDFIRQKGYADFFGHGTGHGVGLAVHEEPRISPLRESFLSPGMVFTIEPGIYLPGWGGVRLENMVLVTEDGCEVLNGLGQDAGP